MHQCMLKLKRYLQASCPFSRFYSFSPLSSLFLPCPPFSSPPLSLSLFLFLSSPYLLLFLLLPLISSDAVGSFKQ